MTESGKVLLLGSGSPRLAPLYRDDVVEAILHAALDPATPTGTFEFAGPDTVTAEELALLLNSKPIRTRRIPVTLARLLARVTPTLTPELVDVMASDAVPTEDVAATARLFGVELHHLRDVWRSR